LVRRNRSGNAFGVEAVERFLDLFVEARSGKGDKGSRGQRAEQVRSAAAGRLLAAQVTAQVDLDLFGPGQDAGDGRRLTRVEAGVQQELLGLGADFAARFLDQAPDVDVSVGQAAVGRSGDGAGEAVFAGQRFAVGGFDDFLEDL